MNIISFNIRKMKLSNALGILIQWGKELLYKYLLTRKLHSILSHISQLINYTLLSIPSNPVVIVDSK